MLFGFIEVNNGNIEVLKGFQVFFGELSLDVLDFILSTAFVGIALSLGDDHEGVSSLDGGSPEDLFPGDNIRDSSVGLKADLQMEDFSLSVVEFEIDVVAGNEEVFEFLFVQRFKEVVLDALGDLEGAEPELENIGKSGLLDHAGSIVSGSLEGLEAGLGLEVTDLGGGVGLEHIEDGLQRFNGLGELVEVSSLGESNEGKDNEGASELSH